MMPLQPGLANALFNSWGQNTLWRRATLCPCRNPDSGSAAPDCPTCRGVGVFWSAGLRCTVAQSGQKTQRAWQDFGQYQAGDVVLSLPSDSAAFAAGEHDQFVMMDSEIPFAAAYTRGSDERYPPGIIRVEQVVVLNNQRQPVVTANPTALPDPMVGGAPTWPGSGGPDVGQQYSIRARRRPTFFLFQEFPQDRAHFGGLPLPRRVVARLLDLFGR